MSRKNALKKVCEFCQDEYDTLEKRSRFCSRSCAAKYNNSRKEPMSEEQKKKISASLRLWHKTHVNDQKGSAKHSQAVGRTTKGKYKKDPKSMFDLSSRTRMKLIKRLKLKCFCCGWDKGSCDIHHIRGKKIPDPHNHDNLTNVCPNCHRLLHEGGIESFKIKTIEQVVGDKWESVYYG
ncbi:MAG: HNH endonuclease signature motif containing protein [Synergistaceae bacterium]